MGQVHAAGRGSRPAARAVRQDVLAWVVAAVALALGVAAQPLAWLDGMDALGRIVGAFVVLVVPFAVIGGVLVSRRAVDRIGWLFLAIAALGGLALFAEAYATRGLVGAPGSLPGAREAALLADLSWWVPLVVLLTWVVLLFPDGRPPSPRWRVASWAAGAGLVLAVTTLAIAGWSGRGETFTGAGDTALPTWATRVGGAAGVILLGSALASLAALVARFRRATGVERAQLRWFLAGSLAAGLGIVALLVPGPLGLLAGFAGIAALPAAAAVAILRYRLYELDLVVNRSLVWATLTGLVIVTYLVVSGGVALVVGQRADATWVAVVTAVVVTASFGPVRTRVQRGVNRLTFGDRADPYRVLAALTERLEAAPGRDDVLGEAVEDIARSLRLTAVAVHRLTDSGERHLLASTGAGPTDHVLGLRHGGRAVGALSVGGRTGGEPLTERDHRLLADVGGQLAVAVHAASLTTELAAAHRRLLEAREVERRKLRDDLHDGLGPSLAAIAAGIEVVRLRLDAPRGADAEVTDVLERTLREIDRAIASTRTIVRGLRPPVLDELGLLGALEERCRQPGAASFEMEADPTDLATLPAAVEVAILHLVDEAITNVWRHADATRCRIRLEGQDREAGAGILVTVLDDGHGIPAGTSAGVGLASMRQRVTELGGDFQIASDRAGTRVTAWLPVGATS